MHYVSSTDARNSLSKALEMAQRGAVTIQKQGRDVAVILSPQDFARITHDNTQDFLAFCGLIGARAKAQGLDETQLSTLLED